MKTMLAAGIAALALLAANPASAARVMSPLQLTFESGAVFRGMIEIEDDFSRAYWVDGLLTNHQGGTIQMSHLFHEGANQLPNSQNRYETVITQFECPGAPSCGANITLRWGWIPGVSTRPTIWYGSFSPDRRGNLVLDGTKSFFGIGVPEPATWAMLIAGFGLVGHAIRRARRRQSSPAPI